MTRHVKFREKIITTFLGRLFLYEYSLLTVTYSGRSLFLQWESLVQQRYLLVEGTHKRKSTNFYILLHSENFYVDRNICKKCYAITFFQGLLVLSEEQSRYTLLLISSTHEIITRNCFLITLNIFLIVHPRTKHLLTCSTR